MRDDSNLKSEKITQKYSQKIFLDYFIREKIKSLNKNNFNSSTFNFYLNVSIIGAIRGGICLLIEHPLESIKTQWQDKININSKTAIIKDIYFKKGILGFYRGFLPNFIRVTSKQLYRWPLMVFFPKFYQKNLPEYIKKRFDAIHKILTGLTIANIEILIITPLDRIKIYFMTSNFTGVTSSKLFYFYSTHKHSLIQELYRGMEPTFWRSNVSWISFLYLDYRIKKIFKYFRKSDILSFLDLLLVSVFVGAGNLLSSRYHLYKILNLVMPFDFVKTQMQKEGCHQEKTFQIMTNYIKNNGIRILYIGWQFKMLQYIVNSIFTVVTLDTFERKAKNLL